MKLAKTIILITGLFTLLPVVAAAQGPTEQPSVGAAAFARLAALAGEWHGTIPGSAPAAPLTVTYRVTAAGSVVMETIMPGTPHEMVTMYHLDKGTLMLTHYCAAGNQPRMVLDAASTPRDLRFDFAGGSNLDPQRDGHMHAVRIVLRDDDHIESTWQSWAEGKPAGSKAFALERKR
jgi:hypothetical protein